MNLIIYQNFYQSLICLKENFTHKRCRIENSKIAIVFNICLFFSLETFPNATNPMKIIPSPSLPNLKVQRLNVLNKLSTIKGSCIAINSDDGTEQNTEHKPAQNEQLERRTIDSKHISTVSSLVATKSEDDVAGKSAKESQQNNFGLYALKFHRNLATHANTMFTNFKKDIGKRSKTSGKTTSDESTVSESPKFNTARANRSKHEYFEPCPQQTHYNGDDNEFDDNGSSTNIDVWNNSNRFQRNRFKNDTDNIVNGPNARAPVRPRRIKPAAPKAYPIAAHDIEPTRNKQYLPYKNTQNTEDFDSDQNVMNI